jgi:MoxR-like ATPase
MTSPVQNTPEQAVSAVVESLAAVRGEVGKLVVGQRDILDGVLICLMCSGHALLEGVPGLGKTVLVRTLASALDLDFSRIQFTPDLMPADIVGTMVLSEDEQGHRRFEFQQGPIFAHVVLADEINRTTPKTQSALLEAMQEHSVTVGKTTHTLQEPFLVLATQNPLEMEGTYPLPEAQLDRFLLKLHVELPERAELREILERTTSGAEPTIARQDPRRDETVAAVVAAAAHDRDAPPGRGARGHGGRHAASRGLHQDRAGKPDVLDGGGIEPSHLRGGRDRQHGREPNPGRR